MVRSLYKIAIKILIKKQRKLIVTHSLKRSEKDNSDREKAVKKFQKKLSKSKNPTLLISNFGHKRLLKPEGKASVKIDTEKMKEKTRLALSG